MVAFFVIATSSCVTQQKPKNIVFIIGDGMRLLYIYAGMVTNGVFAKWSGFEKQYWL